MSNIQKGGSEEASTISEVPIRQGSLKSVAFRQGYIKVKFKKRLLHHVESTKP
jgi:hypothetical protein